MQNHKIEERVDLPWNAVVNGLQEHIRFNSHQGVLALVDLMVDRGLYFVMGSSPSGRKSARFITMNGEDEVIKGQYSSSDQDHKYVVAIAALRALGSKV